MNIEFKFKKYPSYILYIIFPISINVLLNLFSNHIEEDFRIILIMISTTIFLMLIVLTARDLLKEYYVILSPEGIVINKTNFLVKNISEVRLKYNLIQVYFLDKNNNLSFSLNGHDKEKVINEIKGYCKNYGISLRDYRKI